MTHQKVYESRDCEFCGKTYHRKRDRSGRLEDLGKFNRRRFCSVSCSAKRRRPREITQARREAQRHNAGKCEVCTAVLETLVHHVDGDSDNNEPDNRQTLCLYCHSFWHAMLRRVGLEPTKRMPRLV